MGNRTLILDSDCSPAPPPAGKTNYEGFRCSSKWDFGAMRQCPSWMLAKAASSRFKTHRVLYIRCPTLEEGLLPEEELFKEVKDLLLNRAVVVRLNLRTHSRLICLKPPVVSVAPGSIKQDKSPCHRRGARKNRDRPDPTSPTGT